MLHDPQSTTTACMDMKLSWLNHQYKRLRTASENIWFFDKKVQPVYIKTSRQMLITTPKVHFGKKHPITELKNLLRVPLMETEDCSVEKTWVHLWVN